jgi:hypothetical protein
MRKMKAVAHTVAMLLFGTSLLTAQDVAADKDNDARRKDERLIFQTFAPWTPRTNMNADVALVYGVGSTLPSRMSSWQSRNYKIQGMTGVAWGQYQDYLDGQFDGKSHWDEAQKYKDGTMALHGDMARITPYMSPGDSYGRYLSKSIREVLDTGAEAITLEEPEYYADTGWSENFKRRWKAFYGEDWRAPDSSPDAQYRASKLKYELYRRALADVFGEVRAYGREHGRTIRCYVGTHSLINYAHWTVVSPESSLMGVGADGYIAQIWTGTARTPTVYEGHRRERTFSSAFLEYGAMENMVQASGSRLWFLNDPVEDDRNHDWNDYRKNWEATLVASLLHPDIWRYEITPWPDRVFNGKHLLRAASITKGAAPDSQKVGIPDEYATEVQSVISALGDMKQANISWERSGTENIGVLISDTMMFQRADPVSSDENLGSFYGLALPLLAHGIPVEPVQIENAASAYALDRYKLLLLTYEGQKPPSPKFHEALARWVRAGGALVVVDDDHDPYNAVREWWNKPPLAYRTPRQHLFESLGVSPENEGGQHAGKGIVLYAKVSPAALTYKFTGADAIRAIVQRAAKSAGLPWRESNALVLRRGPYLVAAGLEESLPNGTPYQLHGRFIDLFDAALPVLTNFEVVPGKQSLLIDLDSTSQSAAPYVLAAACRITQEKAAQDTFSFFADGIEGTSGVVRVKTDRRPDEVLVGGSRLPASDYRMEQGTLWIRFPNHATASAVEIRFAQ